MASTSGTYNFLSITGELIIREAFERIGIIGDLVVAQQMESANRSVNFLLAEWASKSVNLWTLTTSFLSLIPNQSTYTLPAQTNNVIQVNLRTSFRQLQGMATSNTVATNDNNGGGNASNVFNPNNNTVTNVYAASVNSLDVNYNNGAAGIGATLTSLNNEVFILDGVNPLVGSLVLVRSQATSLQNGIYTVTVAGNNATSWVLTRTSGFDTTSGFGTVIFIQNGNTLANKYTYQNSSITAIGVSNIAFFSPITNVILAAPCVQTNGAGNIAYNYGVGNEQEINFIGIQSGVNQSYTFIVEYSLNGIAWVPLFNIPLQSYTAGITTWFEVPIPVTAQSYRIRGTTAVALNITQIYFNNTVIDTPISAVSRVEYFTYPMLEQQGRPSIYYFDKQIVPRLSVWPTPLPQYNCLFYSYSQMIQDFGNFTNALQIPSRFYQALVWGLAWLLAVKNAPERAQMLKAEYEQAFNIAMADDVEDSPIRIYGDFSDYAGIR